MIANVFNGQIWLVLFQSIIDCLSISKVIKVKKHCVIDGLRVDIAFEVVNFADKLEYCQNVKENVDFMHSRLMFDEQQQER